MEKSKKTNYFQGTKHHSYHISVGAVVVNNENKIAVHYFKELHIPSGIIQDFYLLMRETINPHETLEEGVNRGLMEEFGMKAKLRTYVGSHVQIIRSSLQGYDFQKTTLYFLLDYISHDEAHRRVGDFESGSEIRWLDPAELIIKMKEQGERLGIKDTDESEIVGRVQKMLGI